MKLKYYLIGIAAILSFFMYSCDCGCQNGTDAGVFFECECECDGNWTGSDCDACFLFCKNGGEPDSYCETCICPEGFTGPLCDTATGNQYITLNLADGSGSVELEPTHLTLLIGNGLLATAQYTHPLASDQYELNMRISDSTIQAGFGFIYGEESGIWLRNNTNPDTYLPDFGEMICTYDENKHILTGSYFIDMHSNYTGKNISISGEFRISY